MAVNGIYGSNSSLSTYGSKGMSGLMSGMDVDEIVKGMTMGTTGKISKQLQNKQLLGWKSEAYRALSSKLIDFSNNFMSFTSSTNLLASNFFSKSSITASGTNSKYVTTTGKSNSADSLQILEVKQMAKDATQNLMGGAKGTIDTAEFDLGDTNSKMNNVQGQTLTVRYQNKDYYIEMKDKIVLDESDSSKDVLLDYSGWSDTIDSINDLIQNDPALDDLKDAGIEFKEGKDGKIKFQFNATSGANGNFEIRGGTKNILTGLGLSVGNKITSSQKEFQSEVGGILETPISVVDKLAEKSISFTYNGTTKSIKLGKASELEAMTGAQFAEHVQGKLDEAFGKNRVEVKFDQASGGTNKEGSLSFKTIKWGKDAANNKVLVDDNTSVIKISNSDIGVMGKDGVFGIKAGTSNRVNTGTVIEDSGLKGIRDKNGVNLMKTVWLKDDKGELYEGYAVSVNGKELKFKATDTISEIMNKINNANAGVKISYNEVSDSFNLRATDGGSSGHIDIKDLDVDQNGNIITGTPPSGTTVTKGNLAAKLFGNEQQTDKDGAPVEDSSGNPVYTYDRTLGDDGVTRADDVRAGQDAIILVDFDGYGTGADAVEITRGSNTFNIDGLNITVTQIFDSYKRDKDGNYLDASGAITTKPTRPGDPDDRVIDVENVVKFSAKADADKIVEAVKKMAEEYNTMVDAIQEAMTQKRERSYAPLTSEQKADMSEDEIKAWEEKAKAGMLFNDTTLASLANDLRFVFSSYVEGDIGSIGISNSGTSGSSYKNNGKITIDESKLRAAISDRPDEVAKLFTANLTSKTKPNGKEEVDITTGGVMSRMKAITEKYASVTGATKGVLVEKAGHPSAPTSLFSNSLQKEMDMIDEVVDRLKNTLSSEESRYYKQFTRLEQLVSQMNSQSSWFSQMTGGQ